jgi:ArsR family transcriptional regulator
MKADGFDVVLPRTLRSVVLPTSFDYITMMEEADVISALSALAQALRLRVFRLLVVAGRSGLTPGAMAEALDVPAATLSFHLKELAHSGLVTQERESRYLIYRAAFDRMNGLVDYLTANCCEGQASAVPVARRRAAGIAIGKGS